MNKKPIKINFDTEVVDTKSTIQAYLLLLGDKFIEPIVNSQHANLSDILRKENSPRDGFKPEILPAHLKNISLKRTNQIEIIYTGNLNQQSEKEYWTSKGYKTKKDHEYLRVLTPKGGSFITYCPDKILIQQKQINRFLDEMR